MWWKWHLSWLKNNIKKKLTRPRIDCFSVFQKCFWSNRWWKSQQQTIRLCYSSSKNAYQLSYNEYLLRDWVSSKSRFQFTSGTSYRIVLQMFLMNRFLQTDQYSLYGIEVLKDLLSGRRNCLIIIPAAQEGFPNLILRFWCMAIY